MVIKLKNLQLILSIQLNSENLIDKVKGKIPEIGDVVKLKDGTEGIVKGVREIVPNVDIKSAKNIFVKPDINSIA